MTLVETAVPWLSSIDDSGSDGPENLIPNAERYLHFPAAAEGSGRAMGWEGISTHDTVRR